MWLPLITSKIEAKCVVRVLHAGLSVEERK
jgi:hypothetical protein